MSKHNDDKDAKRFFQTSQLRTVGDIDQPAMEFFLVMAAGKLDGCRTTDAGEERL